MPLKKQFIVDCDFGGRSQACIYAEKWIWTQKFVKNNSIWRFLDYHDSNAKNITINFKSKSPSKANCTRWRHRSKKQSQELEKCELEYQKNVKIKNNPSAFSNIKTPTRGTKSFHFRIQSSSPLKKIHWELIVRGRNLICGNGTLWVRISRWVKIKNFRSFWNFRIPKKCIFLQQNVSASIKVSIKTFTEGIKPIKVVKTGWISRRFYFGSSFWNLLDYQKSERSCRTISFLNEFSFTNLKLLNGTLREENETVFSEALELEDRDKSTLLTTLGIFGFSELRPTGKK